MQSDCKHAPAMPEDQRLPPLHAHFVDGNREHGETTNRWTRPTLGWTLAHAGSTCDRVLRQQLRRAIQRGNENCPMNAQTVQKITTMREFIHSAGMVQDSKDTE